MDIGLHERDMSQMSNLIHLATERSNSLKEVIMSAQSGVWPGPILAKYRELKYGIIETQHQYQSTYFLGDGMDMNDCHIVKDKLPANR